jgi:uncharacterized protein YdcH (DUF465 family)
MREENIPEWLDYNKFNVNKLPESVKNYVFKVQEQQFNKSSTNLEAQNVAQKNKRFIPKIKTPELYETYIKNNNPFEMLKDIQSQSYPTVKEYATDVVNLINYTVASTNKMIYDICELIEETHKVTDYREMRKNLRKIADKYAKIAANFNIVDKTIQNVDNSIKQNSDLIEQQNNLQNTIKNYDQSLLFSQTVVKQFIENFYKFNRIAQENNTHDLQSFASFFSSALTAANTFLGDITKKNEIITEHHTNILKILKILYNNSIPIKLTQNFQKKYLKYKQKYLQLKY